MDVGACAVWPPGLGRSGWGGRQWLCLRRPRGRAVFNRAGPVDLRAGGRCPIQGLVVILPPIARPWRAGEMAATRTILGVPGDRIDSGHWDCGRADRAFELVAPKPDGVTTIR